MKYPVRRRARAELELLAHVERIAEADRDSAIRFVDAVDEALERLSELPEMGAPYESDHPRLQGIRKWVLPGFRNFVLFYLFDGQAVHLLHVFDGRSDYERSM